MSESITPVEARAAVAEVAGDHDLGDGEVADDVRRGAEEVDVAPAPGGRGSTSASTKAGRPSMPRAATSSRKRPASAGGKSFSAWRSV